MRLPRRNPRFDRPFAAALLVLHLFTPSYGQTEQPSSTAPAEMTSNDWTTLQPANPPHPLLEVPRSPEQEELLRRFPNAPRFQSWTTDARTIGELAQLYADHGKLQVRLSPALHAKPRQYTGGSFGTMGPMNFAQPLESLLRREHIEIRRLSNALVELHDDSAAHAAREANRPQPASPEVIARAYAAVSVDAFWQSIEQARSSRDDPEAFLQSLRQQANTWSVDQLVGFEFQLRDRIQEAFRWDIWGVAYLINGGCSDDGFYYFRHWLVAQGRSVFEAALAEPESIAEHADHSQQNELEELGYVIPEIHERKTGREMPFKPFEGTSYEPTGERWEEADLPKRFPNVAKRFP